MFLLYFVRAVPYSRVLRAAAERSSLPGGDKRIHLRIDEEGLYETGEGKVESFAPWSAFRCFAVPDGHLVIELAGDLWANILSRDVQSHREMPPSMKSLGYFVH